MKGNQISLHVTKRKINKARTVVMAEADDVLWQNKLDFSNFNKMIK